MGGGRWEQRERHKDDDRDPCNFKSKSEFEASFSIAIKRSGTSPEARALFPIASQESK